MKKEIKITTKQGWQLVTNDTLWNVTGLLDSTTTLINYTIEEGAGTPAVAAGLYTFAVEEFGKYLYLKSLEPIDGKYHIDYSGEFLDHTNKFKRALSYLPDECKLVRERDTNEDFIPEDFNPDVIANFETRKRVFYTDLDPNFANKVPQMHPQVDEKLLKSAVQKFWEIANSELAKFTKENPL